MTNFNFLSKFVLCDTLADLYYVSNTKDDEFRGLYRTYLSGVDIFRYKSTPFYGYNLTSNRGSMLIPNINWAKKNNLIHDGQVSHAAFLVPIELVLEEIGHEDAQDILFNLDLQSNQYYDGAREYFETYKY